MLCCPNRRMTTDARPSHGSSNSWREQQNSQVSPRSFTAERLLHPCIPQNLYIMRLSCLAGAGGPASVLCGITQLSGRSPADSSLSGAPVSEELRHILAGMDTTRVRRLQRWFEDQAVALRVIPEASEAHQARSAELARRLAARPAPLAPSRPKSD